MPSLLLMILKFFLDIEGFGYVYTVEHLQYSQTVSFLLSVSHLGCQQPRINPLTNPGYKLTSQKYLLVFLFSQKLHLKSSVLWC